ncbi:hypothetical protein BU17DRAFT_43494, partial [Hysterangium stoloniferum]
PCLVEAWRANVNALNSHTCMLNIIGLNGVFYFSCLMSLRWADGVIALHIRHMASNDSPGKYDADVLKEIWPFFSTLLMFQGTTDADSSDIRALVPKLRTLKGGCGSDFVGETAERSCDFLVGDRCVYLSLPNPCIVLLANVGKAWAS